MGHRQLDINVDLLVDLLEGWGDGKPRYFEVTSDPIPKDAKILSVQNSVYRNNVVEVTLSSPSWEDAAPRARVNPCFRTVTLGDQDERDSA